MTDLNPNYPDTIGLEWFPTRQLAKALSSAGVLGAQVEASASETLAKVKAWMKSDLGGYVVCDVYDLATDPAVAQSWAMALPATNQSNAVGWVKSASGVETPYDANAHNNVDDVIGASTAVSTGASDQLRYQGLNPSTAPQIRFFAGNTFYDGDTGAGGASIAGKRIASVEVVVVVENDTLHSVRLNAQVRIGGIAYACDTAQVIEPSSGLKRLRFAFPFNPATFLPWTNADAVALTDGTNSFGVAVITKSGTGNFIVTATALQFLVSAEDRLATANAAVNAGSNAWKEFDFINPADGTTATISTTAGHEYLYTFRLFGPSNAISMVGVDSANLAGHETDELTGWLGDYRLAVAGVPIGTPLETPWVPALFTVTSAPALGADSQPYVTPVELAVGALANRQSLGTHPTAAYGGVSLIVAATTAPTAPLTVKVHRTSDNVQMGGTITIDPSEVPLDGKYHLLRHRLGELSPSNASLATATAYYLAFTSTSSAWKVIGAYTRHPTLGPTADDTTAAGGSISGSATWDGTANSALDVLANLQSAPAAPATLAATLGSHTLSPSPPGGPTTIKYAHLDWASTALGASFLYYELQRSDDAAGWVTIHRGRDEAKSFFNDFEPLRGVSASYRVRVIRADGALSDWTT